jgi:hypothetical protein
MNAKEMVEVMKRLQKLWLGMVVLAGVAAFATIAPGFRRQASLYISDRK